MLISRGRQILWCLQTIKISPNKRFQQPISFSCRQHPSSHTPQTPTIQFRSRGLTTQKSISHTMPSTESQRVDAPLTQFTTFLVLLVTDAPDAIKTVRLTLAKVSSIAKNVAIRDLNASFSCNVGMSVFPARCTPSTHSLIEPFITRTSLIR